MRTPPSPSVPPRTANTPAGTATKTNIPRHDVTGRISVSVSVTVKHFLLQFGLSEGFIHAAGMSLWCTAPQSRIQAMFGKNDNLYPNRRERNLLPAG